MNPTYQQLDQYSHYLEGQLEKFSAFMLTQKKLNEKHILIGGVIDRIMEKVLKIEDKIKLIEINEKDNFEEMRKIRAEKDVIKSMQIRIQNLQHKIVTITKLQKRMYKDEGSKQPEESGISCEKYLSLLFLTKQDVQQIMTRTQDEIEIKVKKLQIQVDQNKQSFLKLHQQIRKLSNKSNNQTPLERQLKSKTYYGSQSTKVFQAVQSQSRNKLSLSDSHEKDIRFKNNCRNDKKKLESKSLQKKLSRKKSHERLSKINQDYMLFP